MKLFYFTEEEAKLVSEMLGQFARRNTGNEVTGPQLDQWDDMFPPEVYVANVPAGGIPARSGLIVSGVSCDIYKLATYSDTGTGSGVFDERQLEDAGFNKVVYNISGTAIATGYRIVQRDKFGRWIIEDFC